MGAVRLPKILVLTIDVSLSAQGVGSDASPEPEPEARHDPLAGDAEVQEQKVYCRFHNGFEGGAVDVLWRKRDNSNTWRHMMSVLPDEQVSTRILGRRTAPSPPFLIPCRAPHGSTPRS